MTLYKIELDGLTIHDPTLIQNERMVLTPKLTLELGKAGSLSFTMPPDNVGYNFVTKLKTIVRVYRNGSLIFKGRVLEIERDFYNRKRIYCEGMLAFLNDANIPPFIYANQSVRSFLTNIIDQYDDKVRIDLLDDDVTVPDKTFSVGTVSISPGTATREVMDYTPALDLLTTELTDKYGGYFRTREVMENGYPVNYIDYLSVYDQVATQQIEFGKNLLDITEYITAEDVFTILIPLGKVIQAPQEDEELQEEEVTEPEERVNIFSLPDGVYKYADQQHTIPKESKVGDHLINHAGVNLFGRIEKVQIWDDIESETELLANAKRVLKKGVDSNIKLTLSAVDLNLVDSTVEAYELGDIVRVLSAPHNIDMLFQIIKMDIDMADPAGTTYEFSADYDKLPEEQAQTLRAGGTSETMDTGGTRDSSETDPGYKLSKGIKSTSTTITEKTVNGQKSTKKVEISVSKIQTTKVSTDNIVNGAVTADKLAAGSVTNGKLADGSVTPKKINSQLNATATWLDAINYYTGNVSNSAPLSIGGASVYSDTDYMQFDLANEGYIRLYSDPKQVEKKLTTDTYDALVVFKTSDDDFYALCTGTDGVVAIKDPDDNT